MLRKFEYDVCNVFDEKIFQKQCVALERHIPSLKKFEMLEDVDGSQIQRYAKGERTIEVINDINLGIFIESDFEIESYFN